MRENIKGSEFSHRPVLLRETIEGLNIRPGGVYIYCTAGGGGHSYEIAKRLTGGGRLICIDRDADAISAVRERLRDFGDKVVIIQENFVNLAHIAERLGIDRADGIMMDLGVSSHQLDRAERGFSYNADAPLDMRMDRDNPLDAQTVVNSYPEEDLCRIIRDYGEERFARRIASRIAESRQRSPIESTGELVRIIKEAILPAARIDGPHPAKRTFQAIRIEVNGELDVIAPAIDGAVRILSAGGRLAVITFHSLEDRIVKQTFQGYVRGCTCPRDFPVCVCGERPMIKIVNRKPIVSDKTELEENPRARSAKLRIAEKL
ncbi:MAG: 16S rRNA (cytosine(1402)-N(4))-methyltransferase RsmH [Clostridiales bacterium]|nr:16S rRNA (cytosine(1402)-N(4))-methyltransferase RsmH [Clostridiales bacterium]